MKLRQLQLACLLVFICAVAANWLSTASSSAPNATSFTKLIDARERVASRAVRKIRLPAVKSDQVCSLTVSLPAPNSLAANDRLVVALRDGEKQLANKSLHQGDPDLYTTFKLSGAGEIEISSLAGSPIEVTVSALGWPAASSSNLLIETESNDLWQTANEFKLGQTVWASADDKPYILPLESAALGATPYQQKPELAADRLPAGGVDWFRFVYDGDQPKLVHFELDLLERDNIPVDVSVFTIENGAAKTYERGADPVTPPHEVQALPGNKFTTRIITKGAYYVRVDANHVFYRLRTAVYDPPPVSDPRRAIRAGMDYLVSAGDSWHANTPRHGGLVTRVSSNHFETQLCIACHATHFTTRGELTAKRNGYAVNKLSSLQFLTERLANNPLPFYGHEEASWTRVISASANVLSRLASLVTQYDQEFDGEKRLALLKGVGGYLKIYYQGRTVLPNDESNGNTPLVSAYEVAWYSWNIFNELSKATGDAEYRNYRDQVRSLIEQEKIKNNVDLCYQTMALVEIDQAGYAERIKRNAERILSLQRPDGQWSMLFEPDSPTVEFQTYHCLYTLALAGFSPEQPQIAKSLKFLLDRQQEYGGWFDPKQSYENFRTPFRETQFAVMALSQFYQGNEKQAPRAPKLSESDPRLRLQQIDEIWNGSTAGLIDSLKSDEPLERMSAAAALGRLGDKAALGPLSALLGDRSKLVQVAAAQALRRIAVKNNNGEAAILAALSSRDERTRWGATRIFAQHFVELTRRTTIGDRLIAMLADPSVMVRMQTAKSLTQWFNWTRDQEQKWRIADAFIARMAVPEHAWMRRNLLEGFYSLADENVRYLYNNWIGNLAQKEDRDRAVAGHREASRLMAERVARAIETGNELQREGLLKGLTEFHLRTGGYVNAGRYTRIGNDIETVVFYAEGAPAMERALAPLVNSSDPALRREAILAAYTLRDNTLPSLPLLVMQRLDDSDAAVRGVANEFYRSLPLKVVDQNRRQAIEVLRALLASKYPEAQIAALDRIKATGNDRGLFMAQVRDFTLKADAKVAPAAIRSLADFPELARDPEIQNRITAAMQSSDENLLRAGAQLVLMKPEIRELPAIAAALDSLVKTEDSSKRKLIAGLINAELPITNDLRITGLMAEMLDDRDEEVRSAALNAVRRVKALQTNAAIRAGVAKLTKDPNQRLQGLAIAIVQGQDGNVALDLSAKADQLLDYRFFVQRVMPLLALKGADGNACVNCHTTHTIFKLVEPNRDGQFTDSQLRENYRSALKVIDLANPENSLILRKPTGDASQEGLVGAKKTPHGGGMRWQGASDPAYRVVMEWINGAKTNTTSLKK